MRSLELFALVVAGFPSSLWSQADAVRRVALRIPLGDGVHLAGDVLLPPGDGALPTILHQTPYDRNQHAAWGRGLAAAGYAVTYVSVRGNGGSEGTFLPFLQEVDDGGAVLDWVLDQPWCNGRVGLMGFSSESHMAQQLASTGRDSIQAVINCSGLTDMQELFFPGGAFRLDTMLPWLHGNYLKLPRLSSEEWTRRFLAVPLASTFAWKPGVLERMAEAGSVDTSGILAPVLHLTGWNDVVYRQTLILHHSLLELNGADLFQKLIVGPWAHNHFPGNSTTLADADFGPESPLMVPDFIELCRRWFDHHLKDEGNGIDEEAPVRLFVQGANRWVEGTSWPPEDASERRLYLVPGAGSGAGGLLAAAAPATEMQASFPFDPENPVPTMGGVNSHLFEERIGPRDQSSFAAREDVLFFQGETLQEGLTILGPIRVVLFAATSVRDADFVVKLVAVRPDGYQRIIEDGIVRALYREGREHPRPVAPGEVVRYEIDLGATGYHVPAGNRIGLHVSSSNFPKYDRNSGTGEPSDLASELQKATQTVYASTARPSHLVLSVLASESR